MDSSMILGLTAMLIFIMLLPLSAKGGDDVFDDFFGKVCEVVHCGKGSCVVNTSYPLNFICKCDSGWQRTQEDYNFIDSYAATFLPCVIPQCTPNSVCHSTPPPVSQKSFPLNYSAFDPCYWAYCGEGKCIRDTALGYTCECNPNYYNLLNISVFPCFSECTFGSDCSSLGVEAPKTPDSQGLPPESSASVLHGRFHWIVMLVMSTAMVMWS